MSTPDAAITVRGLIKDFGDGAVLDGIDVEAYDGDITLLMGPNGTGKTILLSCVAGGLHADAGSVEVFGRSPADAKAFHSFMLQDGLLVDELTGRENVAFFQNLHPRTTERWQTVLDEIAFESDALDREVGEYSGGMKRKLELAITLSVDVPLYVLDEPTAALDMTTVDTLHSLLVERTETEKTILMSSHLPTDAQLADRIVFVRDDGVVASGSPAELLAAVPNVVHLEGPAEGIAEYVLDEKLFEAGAERRGYLREDIDPTTIESAVNKPSTSVRVTDPTTTNLFNYYVHVAPKSNEPKNSVPI